VKISPLHDRLVVKRVEESRVSPAGIVIPDSVSEKPGQGIVSAVGKGKILSNGSPRASAVGVGERVLFGKHAGTEVTLNGDEVLVIREEEIMAVLDP
jgi:chaperonin GroES